MTKHLLAIPLATALVSTSILLSAQPAKAVPTCETEVRIRCIGYSVNGKPPLDQFHDSYEECVAQETSALCGAPWPVSDFSLDVKGERKAEAQKIA